MNRAKLWVFTVLVVAAGFLALRSATVSRRAEGVSALDARLASATAHVAASLRSLAHDATAAAAFVARDAKLGGALGASEAAPPPAPVPAKAKKPAPTPPPAADADGEEAALREAARQALAGAERAIGFDLPGATVVTAGHLAWLARKGDPAAEGEAMALLRGAISGQARRGLVRQGGALWYGSAAPAGDGAGVMVLVPLDEAWARTLATVAGADVTLSVPEVKTLSTARPTDAPLLAGATKLAGAGDVGPRAGVDASVGPLKLPKLPQPVGGGAPLRARAVPLEGVTGGFVVVSIAAAPLLDGAAVFFWRGVAVLALVLLTGLVLGLFVRSTESVPQIPQALHAAATRIEGGDFSARAPRLAGKLGTVAAALNRAAELAGPAQAAQGAPAPPPAMPTGEWYQGPLRPVASAPEPVPTTEPLVAAPRPTATIPAAPTAVAAAVAAVPAAAPAATLEVDEEAHWQQVFQDFLRTRASCGEATEGLTYERFRQKLEGNKAQLVAKYACKTVRFQVYVKDGKAALKATPVK